MDVLKIKKLGVFLTVIVDYEQICLFAVMLQDHRIPEAGSDLWRSASLAHLLSAESATAGHSGCISTCFFHSDLVFFKKRVKILNSSTSNETTAL